MKSGNLFEAYPMNGDNGHHSYANNSSYQKGAIEAAKEAINEAIEESFNDDKILHSSSNNINTLRIVDMGCSAGPNTFHAVENIIQAIQNKARKSHAEFQIFFNDHATNDFNALFSSLPSARQYLAMGVPGSFHGRLFPSSSLHLVHSSYALQWLSQVPKDLVDKGSPAWNKGRIHYYNARDEVVKAYKDQFDKDLDKFFKCRAEEVVPGGLVLLTFPGRLNGAPHSQVFSNWSYHLLGSCLMDLVKKGIIKEEIVDSFNIPIYFTSPEEVEEAVERNGSFRIERVECFPLKNSFQNIAKAISSHIRAGFQQLLKHHFGAEILDELFRIYLHQLEVSPLHQFGVAFSLFFTLQRKPINMR